MKFKFSKKQWETIGIKAGWLDKKAMDNPLEKKIDEKPDEVAARLIATNMAAKVSNDFYQAGQGDPDALRQFQSYYPTWGVAEFKECSDILDAAGY